MTLAKPNQAFAIQHQLKYSTNVSCESRCFPRRRDPEVLLDAALSPAALETNNGLPEYHGLRLARCSPPRRNSLHTFGYRGLSTDYRRISGGLYRLSSGRCNDFSADLFRFRERRASYDERLVSKSLHVFIAYCSALQFSATGIDRSTHTVV